MTTAQAEQQPSQGGTRRKQREIPPFPTTAQLLQRFAQPLPSAGKAAPICHQKQRKVDSKRPFQRKSDYFQRSYCRFIWLARSLQAGCEDSRLPPNCQENKSFNSGKELQPYCQCLSITELLAISETKHPARLPNGARSSGQTTPALPTHLCPGLANLQILSSWHTGL